MTQFLRLLEFAGVVTAVVLIAAEVAIYSPPVQQAERQLSASLQSVESGPDSVTVRLVITHSVADRHMRLVALPVKRHFSSRTVYVYDDLSYPSAGVGPTAVQGMFDHLAGEFVTHGYPGAVHELSAVELLKVFRATDRASSTTVVLMTGVLPANVFSPKADFLSPWVKAGGIAVWGGGTIGFWSSGPQKALTSGNAVGESGTRRLLGPGIVQYPTQFGRTANTASDVAIAFQLAYRFDSDGVLVDPVIGRGGANLGWYTDRFASIAFLPYGAGGYLSFGGEIPDESAAADDLAKILISQAEFVTTGLTYRDLDLAAIASGTVVQWVIPIQQAPAGMTMVAFDTSTDSTFFEAQSLF